MGTPGYMSPEQARGQKVDARSDLFSLGVVLYELITGARPFTGATRNHVLVAILDHEPPPLAPGLPEGLQPIVSRMLAKERTARYGTARELLAALRQLKAELVAAEVRSSGKTSGVAEAASNTTSGLTKAGAPGGRRAFRLHKLGALAAVALLAALGWLGWQWLGTRPAPRFAAQERLQLTKLTNSGRISSGLLSPDGRFAAYQTGSELWISQLAEGNANRLLPDAQGRFYGVAFARDSTLLYYCSRPADGPNYTLYQIPVLGGTPRKLLDGVKTLAVSPVDGRLVLLRSVIGQAQFSVSLAQPDGSGEQAFFTTDRELNHFAWSPDGSRVAYSRYGKDERGNYCDVVERRLADGRERILVPRYPYQVEGVAWLPDDEGLLFCAEDEAKGVRQIWRVDYRGGARRNVTNDLNNYYGLSLSADGGKLLTVIHDRPA
ncbi:MAG: protein kinase domain-containing protein, partial [Pseudomonadota bacterium]